MKCNKCGNLASDSARFCNRCGSALSPVAGSGPGVSGILAAEGVPLRTTPDRVSTAGTAANGGAAPPLLERLKNILLSPRSEWARIATESSSIGELYLRYALPLLLAMALLSFVHMSVIGTSTFFGGTIRTPMSLGLTFALATVIVGAIGLGFVSLVINLLAPTFGAQRELRQAFKVAVYTVTPSAVASVFSLLPGLGMLLGLVALLYGIYVLYLGLVPVMQTPKDRAVGYTASIIVVTFVLGLVLEIAFVTLGGASHLMGFSGIGQTPAAASRDEGAATLGNVLGGMLGSDDKGKSDLGAAIANLAKAGEKMDNAPAGLPSAERAPTAVQPAAPSSDDAQNAGAAVGGLLSALGGALNGGRRVDPVDYGVLKGFLPDSLPQMQRVSAEGSAQQGLGMKGTSSKAVYTGTDGARVEIDISDASAVSGLMNIADAMPQTTSSSSDTGYEKDVMIGGYRAHEKYDSSAQHAELSFMLAKRFTVDLSGDHVDMRTLESDAGRINLDKLASMKDAGAH